MTALSEIRDALKAARPAAKGRERVVLVGDSAQTALYADMKALADDDDPRIDGVPVQPTAEFRGWAIRDVDGKGVWHDVGPA